MKKVTVSSRKNKKFNAGSKPYWRPEFSPHFQGTVLEKSDISLHNEEHAI
jgi:hypothetical protein